MKHTHIVATRMAFAAVAVAVAGCASEPIAAGTMALAGLISGTTEVAIVTGRTITNVIGVGIETIPRPIAPPAQSLLPK